MNGISINSQQFKKLGFTHFFDHDNEQTTCFVLDHCENCGEAIQAANSIGGATKDIPFYVSIGMKQINELPPEGYYSDDLQGEACDHCNG